MGILADSELAVKNATMGLPRRRRMAGLVLPARGLGQRRILVQAGFLVYFVAIVILLNSCATYKQNVTPSDKDRILAQKFRSEVKYDADAEYENLVKQVKQGNTNIDLSYMRECYTRTKYYKPYEISDILFKAVSGTTKQQIKNLEEILDTCFVYPRIHKILALLYEEIDKEKLTFHLIIYLRLIRAIISSGDGLSFNSAYVVHSVSEEYDLIGFLGLEMTMQQLVEGPNGRMYDILTVRDKAGKKHVIYFDINRFFGQSFKLDESDNYDQLGEYFKPK